MTRTSPITLMITQDLGYCCPYAFFTLYKGTTLVADRLGVTSRAIRKHKAAIRDGCSSCAGVPGCLKAKGVLKGKSPLR